MIDTRRRGKNGASYLASALIEGAGNNYLTYPLLTNDSQISTNDLVMFLSAAVRGGFAVDPGRMRFKSSTCAAPVSERSIGYTPQS